MANFLDKSGLETVLQSIASKFAKKSEVPEIWTGTEAEYNAISSKSSSTLYFIY